MKEILNIEGDNEILKGGILKVGNTPKELMNPPSLPPSLPCSPPPPSLHPSPPPSIPLPPSLPLSLPITHINTCTHQVTPGKLT